MATLPDISIPNDQYVSLNTLSGIAIGTAMDIQVKGVGYVYVQQSVTQPSNDSQDGSLLSDMSGFYATAFITAGSEEVWAKSAEKIKSSVITVQER